jgi:2-dehydropantoate 2-reductase
MIAGIGAMGCLFAARLSPHTDVTLIGSWPDQLRALREAPLRLVFPDGHQEEVALCAASDAGQIAPVDVALIVTKAPKTLRAAQQVALALKPDGIAISLQNGTGHREMIAQVIDPQRVTLGVTTLGASTGGQPGIVHWNGIGMTHLAAPPYLAAQVKAVAALFDQAGLPVRVAEDVSALVWGKLAVNAAINPLTAVLRVSNGALLESEWARGLLRQSAQEVAAVAAAQQIWLPFEDAAAQAEQVARQTARNTSSMLQDVLRGASTEIDAICGAVIAAGVQFGIETPANRVLYALVKTMEDLAGLKDKV